MSRRISQPYRCRPIEQLARQMLFAPPDKRVRQVIRAEKLHDAIDPAAAYPYEFIAYRITGYRAESDDGSLLVGEAVLADLRLLIDGVSRSVGLPGNDEPGETPEELARRLSVSTKTVSRWRSAGLRWRWVAVEGSGYRKLVLPRSAVERFLDANRERVERAARFTQMDDATRSRLIARARRLSEARGVSLNHVAHHLARRTGRALETLRVLLEHHDAEHPDNPIFIDRTGPLDAHQKRLIERAHRMGVSVTKMARKLKRTRTTIYRVLHERRAAALRRLELRYTALPVFTRDDADEVLLRHAVEVEGAEAFAVPAADLAPELRDVFSQAPLTEAAERSLVVRLNYLRFKADRLRGALDRHDPRAADLNEIDSLLAQAAEARARIVAGSQRLVLSVARRHLVGQADASSNRLLQLLELGQDVLLAAIDEFDPGRGQTFDAYLTWALMRRFAGLASGVKAQRRVDPQSLAERIRRASLRDSG